MCSNVFTTSSAVSAEPSWNFAPSRSLNVYDVLVAFAFQDSASIGTISSVLAFGLPSASVRA